MLSIQNAGILKPVQPSIKKSTLKTSHLKANTVKPIQFGAGALIGGGFINETLKSLTSDDKKEGKKFRKFLIRKVLPTALLTSAFMNVQGLVKVERQVCNEYGETAIFCEGHEKAQPLETLLDNPELENIEFNTDIEDLFLYARSKQVDLDVNDLRDLAKAGALKGIVSNTPVDAKVTAILIDGTEVPVSIDNTAREDIIREFNIPIEAPPLQWAKFDLLKASLYASATIAAFSGAGELLKRTKARVDKSKDYIQNKKTHAAYETGFHIAAKELNLLEKHSLAKRASQKLRINSFYNKRITLEDVEEIYEKLKQDITELDFTHPKSLNIDAINELRIWTRVYLAGVWAEHYLIKDNENNDPSIVERRVAEKVSAGNRLMASKGANDTSVDWRFVKETPDKAKIETVAQQIFEEELLKAEELISKNTDKLYELYEGFSKIKRLKKAEANKIMDGATADSVKKDRLNLKRLIPG